MSAREESSIGLDLASANLWQEDIKIIAVATLWTIWLMGEAAVHAKRFRSLIAGEYVHPDLTDAHFRLRAAYD